MTDEERTARAYLVEARAHIDKARRVLALAVDAIGHAERLLAPEPAEAPDAPWIASLTQAANAIGASVESFRQERTIEPCRPAPSQRIRG